MLTKQDIQAIKDALTGSFATKDDLKEFATKNDLKAFATKDDLKGFATKEDLHVLKDDLLDALDEKERKILEAVADIIHDGINPVLDNHEERLTKLEHAQATS